MTHDSRFEPGDVVQLRSGGPLLTVTHCGASGVVKLAYFNQPSGALEEFSVPQECLRGATTSPQVPQDARALRSTTVAKSSL